MPPLPDQREQIHRKLVATFTLPTFEWPSPAGESSSHAWSSNEDGSGSPTAFSAIRLMASAVFRHLSSLTSTPAMTKMGCNDELRSLPVLPVSSI